MSSIKQLWFKFWSYFWYPKMRIRAEILSNYFGKLLPKNCSIVDIGGGQGLISKTLAKKLNARVVNTDVADYTIDGSLVPIKTDRLPFKDKEFDFSLIIDVLHHAENPESLLKEAERITKNKIYILENRDPSKNKILAFSGWLFDAAQTPLFGIPLPRTLPLSYWRKMFLSLGLKTEKEVNLRGKIPFIDQHLFIVN